MGEVGFVPGGSGGFVEETDEGNVVAGVTLHGLPPA